MIRNFFNTFTVTSEEHRRKRVGKIWESRKILYHTLTRHSNILNTDTPTFRAHDKNKSISHLLFHSVPCFPELNEIKRINKGEFYNYLLTVPHQDTPSLKVI